MSVAVIDKFNPLPIQIMNSRKLVRDEMLSSFPHNFQLNGDEYNTVILTAQILTSDTSPFSVWVTTQTGEGVTERVNIAPVANRSAYCAKFVFSLFPDYNNLTIWVEGLDMNMTSINTRLILTSDLLA